MLFSLFRLINEPIEVVGQTLLDVAKHHGSSHDTWYRAGGDARMLGPAIDGIWRQ